MAELFSGPGQEQSLTPQTPENRPKGFKSLAVLFFLAGGALLEQGYTRHNAILATIGVAAVVMGVALAMYPTQPPHQHDRRIV